MIFNFNIISIKESIDTVARSEVIIFTAPQVGSHCTLSFTPDCQKISSFLRNVRVLEIDYAATADFLGVSKICK